MTKHSLNKLKFKIRDYFLDRRDVRALRCEVRRLGALNRCMGEEITSARATIRALEREQEEYERLHTEIANGMRDPQTLEKR